MQKSRVALIIIFNHRFDENIKKLKLLYKKRFSHIFILMPFYQGNARQVIPVYGSSHHFQGYIAQSFHIVQNKQFDHYIYIGDDLILHPSINEYNYAEHFQLTKETSFIPEFHPLDNADGEEILDSMPIGHGSGSKHFWSHTEKALHYSLQKPGLESAGLMPSYNEAAALLQLHGIIIRDIPHENIFGVPPPADEPEKRHPLRYPLVRGYSDIAIISATAIERFSFYCGVFFATDLFVEMAIPTALLFATDKVVTEKSIRRNGKVFWLYKPHHRDEYINLLTDLSDDLVGNFSDNCLYIHPIKLSEWKI